MKLINDKVINHRGDVLAEKFYGKWESKDPEVLAFISEQEKPKTIKPKTTTSKSKMKDTE